MQNVTNSTTNVNSVSRSDANWLSLSTLLYPAGGFARARAAEVQAMVKASTEIMGSCMLLKSLPKHMRRRAMSHNTKRLPRTLRDMADRLVMNHVLHFLLSHLTHDASCFIYLLFLSAVSVPRKERATRLAQRRRNKQRAKAAKPGGGMATCCWSSTDARGRTNGWRRTFGTPSASTWLKSGATASGTGRHTNVTGPATEPWAATVCCRWPHEWISCLGLFFKNQ